jgi:hypothetical protein
MRIGEAVFGDMDARKRHVNRGGRLEESLKREEKRAGEGGFIVRTSLHLDGLATPFLPLCLQVVRGTVGCSFSVRFLPFSARPQVDYRSFVG